MFPPRPFAAPIPVFVAAAALLPGCAARVADKAPVVPLAARIGEQVITLEELDRTLGNDLYELRRKGVEEMVTERVVAAAAKKKGLSMEEFVRKAVEAGVPEVPEAEAREFFDKNKERLAAQTGGKGFDDVKAQLITALTGRKRQEGAVTLVETLRSEAGVKVLLEPVKVAVAATGPSRGPADAKVTVVVFSDFQCPYCARGRTVLEEVMKAYPKDVRVVYRDFPLSFHDNAEGAAEAGHCADAQGRFWEMHDWMFDNQDKLDGDALKVGARAAGLDGAAFDACLDGGGQKAAVEDNRKAGDKAGVRGTPHFFVNGIPLSGAEPFEKFKEQIDRVLGK